MNWFLEMAKQAHIAISKLDDGKKGMVVALSMAGGICLPMWIVYTALVLMNKSDYSAFNSTLACILMIFALAVTLPISIFVGGVSKTSLSSISLHRVVLINLLTSVGIAVVVSVTLRKSINIIGDRAKLEDLILLAFVVIWSLMSLNMLKTPWDDLRDRIASANSPEKA